MTRFETIARGAVLSAASIFVSMAALLITGKLFTNALDTETVGIFALLLVSADFINIFSGMGLGVSMPKLVAEADPKQRRNIIGSALAWQTFLLALLGLTALLVQQLIMNPEQITQDPGWLGVHRCLHLLPLLFIAGGLRDLIMAMLAGLDRYGYRAAGISIASITQVILVYVAVWRLGGGLTTLVLAMAASYALALILLWAGLGRAGRPRLNMPVYWKNVWFSGPLYVNQLMTFFVQRFDTVLITALLGVASAAVYEMIKRLPVIVNRVMNALLVPYLPHITQLISSGDRKGAATLLNHATGIAAFVGYGAALGLVTVQDYLIVLVFSPDYLAGAPVLGLLLVAASLALQSGIMGQTLIALGRNRVVPLVNAAAMTISVVANFILIPRLGIAGAGCVAVAASGFSLIMQALYTHRAGIRVSPGQFGKPFLALVICAMLYRLLGAGIMGGATATFSFAALCMFMGIVTPVQLLQLIRALMPEKLRMFD